MRSTLSVLSLLLLSTVAGAEEKRALDAHVHGTGALNIAVEGTAIAMEFEAPGFDIVGFEYAATEAADLAKIDAALATLQDPFTLFAMPEAAGCAVTASKARLLTEDDDHDAHHADAHGHDNHHGEAHGHDDHHGEEHAHGEHHGDGHDHDAHAEAEGHDAHDHDAHDHDAHAEGESSHTAFTALYALNCADVSRITEIAFPYFDTFPGAEKLEVQLVSEAGARSFEIGRDAPLLPLSGGM